MNWFLRNTSPARRYYQDCECSRYGRPYCYACIKTEDEPETEPKVFDGMQNPRWWEHFMKTQLTKRDIAFLEGRGR